jgi:hypothetical protein
MASPILARARAIASAGRGGAPRRVVLMGRRSALILLEDCSTNSRSGRLDHVQERSGCETDVKPIWNGNATELEPNNNRAPRHLLQRTTPSIRTAQALPNNLRPNRLARMPETLPERTAEVGTGISAVHAITLRDCFEWKLSRHMIERAQTPGAAGASATGCAISQKEFRPKQTRTGAENE